MIQRIQTLWLLLASTCGFISLRTSFYHGQRILGPEPKPVVFVPATYNMLLMVFTVTVSVAALIIIFLYKDRKLQMKLTAAAMVLSAFNIFLYYWQTKAFDPLTSAYDLTAIIPLAIPVFIFLALKNIHKDEKLVKSLDRIR